jgi:hypothetical protein
LKTKKLVKKQWIHDPWKCLKSLKNAWKIWNYWANKNFSIFENGFERKT